MDAYYLLTVLVLLGKYIFGNKRFEFSIQLKRKYMIIVRMYVF